MKAILIVLTLFALLFAAPDVAAEDPTDAVCGDRGAKGCVLHVVNSMFPCNPTYQYVKECDPTS